MSGPTMKNFEDLFNAVIMRAVEDYEYLISDDRSIHIPESATVAEIRRFANEQRGQRVDMVAVLDRIDRKHKEFREYCKKNKDAILAETAAIPKSSDFWSYLLTHGQFHCPLCGGIIHPDTRNPETQKFFVCSGCKLNVKINKRGKK